MRVVSNDSKVLTVINRRRGEKGYRLLQGDNLRALFLQLIQTQVIPPSTLTVTVLCLKILNFFVKKMFICKMN
jgi:hypothetical protein